MRAAFGRILDGALDLVSVVLGKVAVLLDPGAVVEGEKKEKAPLSDAERAEYSLIWREQIAEALEIFGAPQWRASNPPPGHNDEFDVESWFEESADNLDQWLIKDFNSVVSEGVVPQGEDGPVRAFAARLGTFFDGPLKEFPRRSPSYFNSSPAWQALADEAVEIARVMRTWPPPNVISPQ